jgi:hypothetical protein
MRCSASENAGDLRVCHVRHRRGRGARPENGFAGYAQGIRIPHQHPRRRPHTVFFSGFHVPALFFPCF